MQNINKKIVNLALLVIGLFLLTACPDDDNKQEEPLEIYPLTVGNNWTYKLNIYPEDDSVETLRESVISIVRDTLVNDKTYFLAEKDGKLSKDRIILKEDGIYVTNSIIYNDEDVLVYKYPCKVGDTWEKRVSDIYIDAKSLSVVKSLNTKVTVPYGTFECIEYENEKQHIINNSDTIYTLEKSYLKVGLGLVKTSVSHKTNYDGVYEMQTLNQLVSATIK
jgi:hypothetical protein